MPFGPIYKELAGMLTLATLPSLVWDKLFNFKEMLK
jgi:hypothetical protein